MSNAKVIVGNIEKCTNELTYEDLCILYEQFILNYKKIPTVKEMNLKHNMPQQRIVMNILKDNNILYNDFLNKYGKKSHVRTVNVSNYDIYMNKFKQICKEQKRTLMSNDFVSNEYGLPSLPWLIENCPDKTVKTYYDFLKWCGLSANRKIWTKEEVSQKLIEYEKNIGRPIVKSDINVSNLGFSEIVVQRLFGSLVKCKQELGLLPTLPTQPKPFCFYKDRLDNALQQIKKETNRTFITWKDIEKYNIEHKSTTKAFKREGLDVFSYIKEQGFEMNPSNFSFHYTFDDGERVLSTMEYEYSKMLKDKGYIYNVDYFKDYRYKNLIDVNDKTTCDYYIDGTVVEIAGMITNSEGDWKTKIYASNTENAYRDNLLKKINLLEKNKIPYILLFLEDFINKRYEYKENNYDS